MGVAAHLKNARLSPQKCRLVADQIRGLPVIGALDLLKFNLKKAAGIIKKVLESAVANAEHNHGLDVDKLSVSSIYVNQGPRYKRTQACAKGRGSRIVKSTSHITVMVSTDGEKQ